MMSPDLISLFHHEGPSAGIARNPYEGHEDAKTQRHGVHGERKRPPDRIA